MRWRARRQIAEPGQAARGAGGNSAASRSPTFSPELWLLPGGAAGWMACGCLALCSAGPGQAKQRVALAAQINQMQHQAREAQLAMQLIIMFIQIMADQKAAAGGTGGLASAGSKRKQQQPLQESSKARRKAAAALVAAAAVDREFAYGI